MHVRLKTCTRERTRFHLMNLCARMNTQKVLPRKQLGIHDTF